MTQPSLFEQPAEATPAPARRLIQYLDGRKGFWRTGELLTVGRKFAHIRELAGHQRALRVPLDDTRTEPTK